MKAIDSLTASIASFLNCTDEGAISASKVLIRNLWNCTLEDQMTGFFAQMIYQIMRPQDQSILFTALKQVLVMMEDARAKDKDDNRAALQARIAARRQESLA